MRPTFLSRRENSAYAIEVHIFNFRQKIYGKNIEVFFESAEEGSKPDNSKETIIPNQVIKPTSPMGIPFAQKEVKKGNEIVKDKGFCPNCGEKLPVGGKFCAKCGTKIS